MSSEPTGFECLMHFRELREHLHIRPYHYILDEAGNPMPTDDILAWGLFFASLENRKVQQDEVEVDGKTYFVSTVFLAMDHNFTMQGPPVLWETMVFGCDEEYMDRYTSREAAIDGHLDVIAHLKNGTLGEE